MVNTIGFRETEKALQLGKLYTAQEALDIKLVDEVVAPENLLQKAEDQMVAWLKIPSEFKILNSFKGLCFTKQFLTYSNCKRAHQIIDEARYS